MQRLWRPRRHAFSILEYTRGRYTSLLRPTGTKDGKLIKRLIQRDEPDVPSRFPTYALPNVLFSKSLESGIRAKDNLIKGLLHTISRVYDN